MFARTAAPVAVLTPADLARYEALIRTIPRKRTWWEQTKHDVRKTLFRWFGWAVGVPLAVFAAITYLRVAAPPAVLVALHLTREPGSAYLAIGPAAGALLALIAPEVLFLGAVLSVASACKATVRWPRVGILTGTLAWAWCPLTSPWWSGLIPVAAATVWLIQAILRAPKPLPVPDERAATWRVLIDDGGVLPGCWVDDRVDDVRDDDGTVIGCRLRVEGRDVRQNAGVIEQVIPAIAAAYETTPDAVTVISVGAHRRCIVQVLDSDYLVEVAAEQRERLMTVREMEGPHFDPLTGIVTCGTIASTAGPMMWTLYVPRQGARHGWIIGGTGSGKSETLSGLLASACSQGIVVPHVIDLAGGASIPEWKRLATSFVTDVPAAVALLQKIEKLYEARLAYMLANELSCMEPSRQWPVHMVMVEEAPKLAGNFEAMRILGEGCRLYRKTLISIIWVSQTGNASEVFGAAGTSMRQQLKTGNILALFLTGEAVGQALSGAQDPGDKPFDPSTLIVPKDVPGAAVVWTPQHRVPELGRCWHVTEGLRRGGGIASWVDIPTDELWDALAVEVEPEQESVAEVLPMTSEARTNRDRVRAILAGISTGEEVSTGQVMASLPDMPKSSLHDALRALADARDTITDGGYGKWRRA